MAKRKVRFVCQECGYESPKWLGKCPGCQSWNTLVEELQAPPAHQAHARTGAFRTGVDVGQNKPIPINTIDATEEARIPTSFEEINRVLGGGIVPGSLVLLGGDPGIGKSTILLQLSGILSHGGYKVLYVSGEESIKQTKMRADRLQANADSLFVLAETNVAYIEEHIQQIQPDVVMIDSIQTVYREEVTSAPGSVAQVRESTASFMKIAKTTGIAIFLVGHVTKEGAIAGPRLLEHMVDAVLYLEGERHHTYRILRAVKNRFGSTNELGIFEMKEHGLTEVANPSQMFLEERARGQAGSVVIASLEGTRPVLVELQALIAPTSFNNPRRMATGVDPNRVALIMAVLEKRVGLLLQNHDAYLNVAGGVRLNEPALDLGIAVSIASSFRNSPTQSSDVIVGEIGLTGEVRGVTRVEQRVHEALKLGFTRMILPKKNLSGWEVPKGITCIGVSTVEEALEVALGGVPHEF